MGEDLRGWLRGAEWAAGGAAAIAVIAWWGSQPPQGVAKYPISACIERGFVGSETAYGLLSRCEIANASPALAQRTQDVVKAVLDDQAAVSENAQLCAEGKALECGQAAAWRTDRLAQEQKQLAALTVDADCAEQWWNNGQPDYEGRRAALIACVTSASTGG